MSEESQYIVSARKYRPSTFASVVGQKTLTQTLKNSISSGRLAQAYLFCGPRGVGKTSCARIFARTINCMNPTPEGEACGVCDSCQAITKGNSFNLIELDAASNNSVDDIRSLIEQVNIPPQQGKYKVFIIDEVHMLSSQAFNAFLKTLEEPPKYAIFILATTEKHKVIPTILSRCQIYDFKRITIDDMVEHLVYVANDRGVEADRRALGIIARKADGAMRDALSIFDQVSASSNGVVTYESALENLNVLDYEFYFKLVESFADGDIPSALLTYKDIKDKGFDSLFFINGLASHIRELMVAADPRTLPLLEADSETASRLKQQTSRLPLQWYYAAMKVLNNADYNYRTTTNKQLLVEVTLIRLCQLLKPVTPPFDKAEDLPSLRDMTKTSIAKDELSPATESKPVNLVPPEGMAVEKSEPYSSDKTIHPLQDGGVSEKTVKRGQGINRPKTIRLNDLGKNDIPRAETRRNRNFTDEEFEEAWAMFIANNPTEHLLLSEMRNARKSRKDTNTITVEIEQPSSQKYFDGPGSSLITFLRKKLGNDHLNLEILISRHAERVVKLPSSEFLKNAITVNPALGNFLKTINAEIR